MFQSFIRNKILTLLELKDEIYNTKKEYSKNAKMPDDKEIIDSVFLNGHTNKKAKGILYLLESASREDKHCTSILALNKYDLEHIMPQSWEINWALDEVSPEKLTDRNNHVGLLGNKTILTSKLNRAIKNAEWNIKKNGNGVQKGLSEYASGLVTFDFKNINEWNENEIDIRNAQLAELINQYWSIH